MTKPGQVVCFGELLMRLATERHERFVQADTFEVGYTGAEANVAASLVNYGIPSSVVSCVPDSELGQACINHLRRFGIDTAHIKRSGTRLGTFYLETGASQRPSKVIYDRACSSITTLQPGDIPWDDVFEGSNWFHFCGTAPALSDSLADVVAEACQVARAKGLTVSCDLNFRKKLWSPEKARSVMTGLMDYVNVMIGNEEDADKVFGIKASGVNVTTGKLDESGYIEVAHQLRETFGFQRVAITLRESLSASDNRWSGLLYDGHDAYFSTKYLMHVVDRVGGGDSFSGGLIYALLTGMEPRAAVEFAAAASCLKHSIHGDFNLVSVNEVMALVHGDASGRVQR